MRAAYYEKNGPAGDVLRVGEVETPQAGPGEVRVRLVTSGVNPSDTKARGGGTRKIAFPRVVPHSDGAGEIDHVGDGVPRTRIGERVWTWNGQWKRAFGTCAEYIVLPQEMAVPLPAQVSFDAGACLGIPALTAAHAVEIADTRSGTVLLITGGAGAVSHYAIQIAKARGATVITTVSSEAKGAVARDAGADHVIDYKRENVGERVMAITGGRGVDAVCELDIVANAQLIASVLRPHGIVVVYGTGGTEAPLPAFFCLINSITLKFMFLYEISPEARARATAEITRMLEADTLKHNIALTLPLDRIVEGHEAVEQGRVMGNVVMRVG